MSIDATELRRLKTKLIRFIKGGYKWVIYAYIFLVAVYIVFFVLLKDGTICKLDCFGTGFGVSFSASFLEDLIVFLILGILGAIVPVAFQKTPNEESYHDRVLALMNSENVRQNINLLEYLKSACTDLLAYNKYFGIKIKIIEYDSLQDVYKLQIELRYIATNMCNDRDFSAKDPNIYVYPDPAVEGEKGYVSLISTFNPALPSLMDKKVDGKNPINERFTYELDLRIPKDGELGYITKFTIWSKFTKEEETNSWFYTFVDRYTQNVDFKIENLLDEDIKLNLRHYIYANDIRKPLKKDELLHSGQTRHIPVSLELFPRDKFEIFLSR